MERSQNANGEEGIDDQADIGYQTSLETIEANHVDKQENQSDDERNNAGLDCLLTQRRTDYVLAYDINGSSHLTGIEHVGKVSCLLEREVTCNVRTAAINLLVNAWSRIYQTIENNGNSLADIGTRNLRPLSRSLRSHGHVNLILTAQLLILVVGINNDVATYGSIRKAWSSVVITLTLQGIEYEIAVALATLRIEALNIPSPSQTAWETGSLLVQHLHDSSSIGSIGKSNASETGIKLQLVEQRTAIGILLKSIGSSQSSIKGSVGRSSIGNSGLCILSYLCILGIG